MDTTIIPITKIEYLTRKFDLNYFDNIIYTKERPTTKIIIMIHERNLHEHIQIYLQNKFHIPIGIYNVALPIDIRNNYLQMFDSNQITVMICTISFLPYIKNVDKIYIDGSFYNHIQNKFDYFGQNHEIWKKIKRLNISELYIRTINEFEQNFSFIQ